MVNTTEGVSKVNRPLANKRPYLQIFRKSFFFSENSSKGPNAHMASEIGIKLAVFKRKNVNRAFHILHGLIAIALQFYS